MDEIGGLWENLGSMSGLQIIPTVLLLGCNTSYHSGTLFVAKTKIRYICSSSLDQFSKKDNQSTKRPKT